MTKHQPLTEKKPKISHRNGGSDQKSICGMEKNVTA
jgi:hypothetical protein